jgi:hypothetical protein
MPGSPVSESNNPINKEGHFSGRLTFSFRLYAEMNA